MISISLDETDGFEKITINDGKIQPAFIAGVIYDDNNDIMDSSLERKRIENFYKEAINEAGNGNQNFRYPNDLHVNSDCSNKEHVGLVKEIVNARLGEFIKEGTYNGKALLGEERKGCYYTYAYVKSERGVGYLTREAANYLTDDDYASNRYINMATGIISRLVLHNPIIRDVDSVYFCLSTRATPNISPNDESAIEYKNLGYRNKNTNGGEVLFYQIVGSEVYRTALAQKMIENKTKIKVDSFDVQPIQYNSISRTGRIEYLYLADTICSILKRDITTNDTEGVINSIEAGLNRINASERNLLFIYDDVDMEYEKAWEYYENNNYYDALSVIYDSIGRNDTVSDYYSVTWYKQLRDNICMSTNLNVLESTVNELSSSLISNRFSPEKGIFIYNEVSKWADNNANNIKKNSRENILVNLYKAGISIHCHTGNPAGALECYDTLKKYAYEIGIEDYCAILNQLAVVMSDALDYQGALDKINECISIIDEATKVRNSISSLSQLEATYYHPMIQAKSYSTKAQILATQRDPKAEEYFNKALGIMEKDKYNYKITLSYLIHYYIEMKDEKKYMENMDYYFSDNNGTSDRLSYIVALSEEINPEINYSYALYVLLKGIYTFEKEKISDKVYKKIINLEKKLLKKDQTILKGHPFEFIYKYIALIAYDHDDEETFTKMIEKNEKCIKEEGAIIKLIILNNKILYAKLQNDKDALNENIKEARGIIESSFTAAKELLDLDDARFADKLSEKLNYMYS